MPNHGSPKANLRPDVLVRPVMEIFPVAWLFFVPFILITTYNGHQPGGGDHRRHHGREGHRRGNQGRPAKVWLKLEGRLESMELKLSRLLEDRENADRKKVDAIPCPSWEEPGVSCPQV